MTTKVSHVPKGASVISPYLVVRKAAEMLDFYKKVFGAIETLRLDQPDGGIGPARSPVGIHVYVEDIDAVYKKALAAGATSLREPANQFYGDRNAQVIDPSGHLWDISTHIEDVSAEEIQKRLAAMPQPER